MVQTSLRPSFNPCAALTKLIPKDTLKWRIDLLESTAAYANSRLHAVTAQWQG
ncbi:hypothetical protein HanIR_Chr02g0058641 [Helianthus annuus]|nr:hypothetical protein HanIR_Chr02g0058641 [Helianthus annuus]